jgi:hypothetical protein
MTFIHGKDTFVSLAGNNISPYSNTTDWEKSADEHDTTTYGKSAHVFQGGLLTGKCSIGGIYDNTVGGPRAVVNPLIGQVVALIHRPEGTGVGKPQDACQVLVKNYKESSPVADMVQWAVEFTISDTITSTTQ